MKNDFPLLAGLSPLAAVLVLVSHGFAQSAPVRGDSPAPENISRAAALHAIDGELWGAGASYKVHFTAQGMEFTPVLGSRAPRNYPLTFELHQLRRCVLLDNGRHIQRATLLLLCAGKRRQWRGPPARV